jgi:hypothetical protein
MAEKEVTVFRDEKEWTRVQLVSPFWRFWARTLQVLIVLYKLPSTNGISGILCHSCKFVYMLGRGFAIDIVYCNREREIVYLMEGLVPYKAGPYLKVACFVLVFPAETITNSNLKVGEQLKW